jgi:hypothetical protein
MPLTTVPAGAGRTLLLAGILLLSLPDVSRAGPPPFRISADVGFGYDSNVANAGPHDPTPATGFASADVNAQYKLLLPWNMEAVLRGTVGGEQYLHYVGLSNAKALAMTRLLFRPDGGFYMPTFAIWGSAADLEFGSKMRSSREFRGGAFVMEQVTTQLGTRIGGSYATREADSRVFDLRGETASLNIDWQVTPSFTSYLGYDYRYGDVVSSGIPSLQIVQVAKVIEADDVFGGFNTNEFAYRFNGHTQVGTLGFNYTFTPHLALDLQAQDINTRAGFGNHYNRTIGVLSLLARF